MSVLMMMKGLPSSGKTTWAKAWCGTRRVRVSWREIWASLGGGRDGRLLAYECALHVMLVALGKGLDVVVDEPNLHGSEWGLFVSRAQQAGARVEWHTMRTDPEECKRRNAERGRPVSDMDIDRLALTWAAWLEK